MVAVARTELLTDHRQRDRSAVPDKDGAPGWSDVDVTVDTVVDLGRVDVVEDEDVAVGAVLEDDLLARDVAVETENGFVVLVGDDVVVQGFPHGLGRG